MTTGSYDEGYRSDVPDGTDIVRAADRVADPRAPRRRDPDAILKAGFELALALIDAVHDVELAR